MLPITLSIIACFGWGMADFIGGLKSRNLPTLSILMVSSLTGTLLLGSLVLVLKSPLPRDPLLFWAVPAGIIGVAAMFLLYRSLAVGVMSILAPVSATGVIMPVVWGVFSGETLSISCIYGIGLAIVGSLMAVMETNPGKTGKKLTRGLGFALGSAFFVGLYFITMDTACTHHPIWASMIMRSTTLLFLIPLLFFTKTAMTIKKIQLPYILAMGALDTMAAFCFAVATSKGFLSQVAVISSLYPAVTVLLSAIITKERIQKIQASGVILAIAGITLISAS